MEAGHIYMEKKYGQFLWIFLKHYYLVTAFDFPNSFIELIQEYQKVRSQKADVDKSFRRKILLSVL